MTSSRREFLATALSLPLVRQKAPPETLQFVPSDPALVGRTGTKIRTREQR